MSEQFSSCSVCGSALASQTIGYLLVARANPSRIMILRWNKTLASRAAAQTACSPEHALEMVAHWMVSGRLDFSITEPALRKLELAIDEKPEESASALTAHGQSIGELVIDRESVRDLVARDPEALASVLDSLLEALVRDSEAWTAKKPVLGTAPKRQASLA